MRPILATLLACLYAAAHAVDAPMEKPLRITGGLVAGVPDHAHGVVAFKGIPYAAPPVGDLRWREPQPPLPWTDVRKAEAFGAQCAQPHGTPRPLPYSLMTRRDAAPASYSEDCLFLNVWTPARSATDRLAVLVHISPGSFPGEGLAGKGIIVVTLNHRLGIIGGMGHPELTRESPHHSCGDYGLLDMIAALRWVQDNIAAFGGDPGRVTIAGYSVGSTCVHHLTTSPVAKGLFHGAICMSFPYDYLMAPHRVGGVWQKEQEGVAFAAVKQAASLAALRRMSAEDLVAPDAAVNGFTRSVLGAAFCLDGWALPVEYPVALDQGLASDVPTLTGLTADDAPGCPPIASLTTTVASFAKELPGVFGERQAAFLTMQDAYRAFCPMTTDAEARGLLKRAQLEYRMATVFHWAARRAAKHRAPVYTYLFTQAMPCAGHPEFGAFHTSDLAYTCNNLDSLDHPWTADDRRVAELASSYWVNFVKNGDPNGQGLPTWAPCTPRDPSTMVLGVRPGPRRIADQERLDFYRRVLGP